MSTVQSTSTASSKQVLVDDKGLSHQQNNDLPKVWIFFWLPWKFILMIPVSWEERPPYSDLDLTDHDDMLKDWYLVDDCIDALEMNNPPVELDALPELRNPVLDSGAVLHARPRECAKQSLLDHSQNLGPSLVQWRKSCA